MATRGSGRKRAGAPSTAPKNDAEAVEAANSIGADQPAPDAGADNTGSVESNAANDNQAAAGNSDERAAPADESPRSHPDPEHVAVAAYYRAEQRGFTGDQQLDDWLAAERSLAAESVQFGDDNTARGVPDEDIGPDQVRQWAEKFNVTPERLRVAIQRVGPVSAEVERFLQNSGER